MYSPRRLLSTPTIVAWHLLMGIRISFASFEATAAAMVGGISPNMASAMTIPTGPTITSALLLLYTTAFSPVAPLVTPLFIIFAVAVALVPTAISSASGNRSFRASSRLLPTPPPWPSITIIRITLLLPKIIHTCSMIAWQMLFCNLS